MVRLFDTECGSLKALNMVRILKHTKSLANICMSGVSKVLVEEAFVAINHDLAYCIIPFKVIVFKIKSIFLTRCENISICLATIVFASPFEFLFYFILFIYLWL